MTNLDATPAAKPTLTAFLKTKHAEGILSSASFNLEAAEIENDVAEWITSLLERDEEGDDAEVLDVVNEVAEYLEGAVNDLRGLIADAHGYLGNIKAAKEALNHFCNVPTEANRFKLASACEAFAGCSIPMDRVNQQRIRPFITSRAFRSRISYGSMSFIVGNLIDPKLIISDRAA